ncbi:MAG: aldehyde dehydrogenase [Chloroflexi bacterium]|nr:aldehyde dehydrogenase [Chloroflexota bacterium]
MSWAWTMSGKTWKKEESYKLLASPAKFHGGGKNMSYGWAGNSLEIDLSQGKIEKKQNDTKLYEAFLGGKGIGSKILWDRVPPQVEAFSSDNLLILATGVLTGTPVPSGSHGCICFKSPQTGLISYSNMGGFWAVELKSAGYDTVVISGKASSPVYLWINNDEIEIRDASHLRGKDTIETARIIKGELNNGRVQVICIGPAGENKVHIASIEHPMTGDSAARTGPGAVMGDKNLKAIAIHGTKDINIARSPEFMELCEVVFQKSGQLRESLEPEGWCAMMMAGWDTAFFGNADDKQPPQPEFEDYEKKNLDFLKKYLVRETGCYNCTVRCQAWLHLPEATYYYPRCESFAFSLGCKIPDLVFSLKCCNLCVRYGLDIVSTARTIAFAIDLYQQGILTSEEVDGMRLEHGNAEVAFTLIEKIAQRKGFGDILANGTYQAARVIGKGAEKHTHLVKKQDISPDFFILSPGSALSLATNDRLDSHSMITSAISPDMWALPRDAYIKGGWWLYPAEYEKYLTDDYLASYNGIAELTYYGENVKIITDLAGLCWWWTGFLNYTAIKADTIISLISHATGMDIDEAKAISIASRTRALMRANDVRLWLRKKDDIAPEILFDREPTRRQQQLGFTKLDRDKFSGQLEKYYELRGWNSQGVPTAETLDELGLDDVRQDLEERGFYKDE